MVLEKASDIKKEEKVRVIVVQTLPTQQIRETEIDGEKVRFVTIEEFLTSMANE